MIHKNLRAREDSTMDNNWMYNNAGGGSPEEQYEDESMGMEEARMDDASGGTFEIVHLNQDELNLMNELQGGEIINNELGLPEFFVLLEMLKESPDIVGHLQEMFGTPMPGNTQAEQHLAPELEQMRQNGINGDNDLAILPVVLTNILDEILEHRGEVPQRNPIDGRKQYWAGALSALAAPLLQAVPGMISSWFSNSNNGQQQQQPMQQMQQQPMQQQGQMNGYGGNNGYNGNSSYNGNANMNNYGDDDNSYYGNSGNNNY